MTDYPTKPLNILVDELKERAKELNCLYEVQETLTQPGINQDESLRRIIKVIPPGWQYPEICVCQIKLGEKTYQSENITLSPWTQHS
jgi:pyruvate,water dikinase